MAERSKTGEPKRARRTASGFRVADDVLGLVGATPLVKLGRIGPEATRQVPDRTGAEHAAVECVAPEKSNSMYGRTRHIPVPG